MAAAPAIDAQAHYNHCLATNSEDPMITGAITADDLDSARWQCDEPIHSLVPERSILRFTLDHNLATPRYLITRRSPLQSVLIWAEDEDGTTRSVRYGYEQMLPAMVDSYIKAPLPEITSQTRHVTVAIDRPTHVMTLEQAHLSARDPGDTAEGSSLLMMLCVLCGMLIMPLVLNSAFYRILREPFVFWHAALTISLMLTILFNSGLTVFIADLSTSTLSRWTTIVFGFSVASGGMFAHSFIEPGKLHPMMRKALPWAALWSLSLSFFHANFPFVGRAWQSDAYYMAYLPVLCLYIGLLVDALRRGSRAARFQLVGWCPLLAVGLMRVGSQFLPGLQPTDAMMLFYLGCAFEVLATTLGVTDRFMAMKDQRDWARTEARMLEQLSERDTLTGMYNRRVLEMRFDELRNEGFTTLAVLDLDHFKSINDTFGHGVGDDVLRTISGALAADADTIAVRLGGEEFALLLRGAGATERAEKRRRAITLHAADMAGLDRPVTASMGVVDAPLDALPNADFEMLYRRADQLLYEAKAAGRNRMMAERMQVFKARKRDRRDKRRKQAA